MSQISTIEEFANKIKKVHPTYDCSKSNYINAYTKIDIICPIHGVFEMIPNNLLRGRGCHQCKRESNRLSRIVNTNKFLDKIRMLHSTYDFSKFIYENCNSIGIVICPIHGEFKTTFARLKQGQRCPHCKWSRNS